jgi:hypothetical protein
VFGHLIYVRSSATVFEYLTLAVLHWIENIKSTIFGKVEKLFILTVEAYLYIFTNKRLKYKN